uniref:Uncharacterized protein n=1 Tax=Oryza barthii TaxID=65489 RepID=A0A0D3FXI4_9ORYZ
MAEVYSKSQFKGYIYAPDQLANPEDLKLRREMDNLAQKEAFLKFFAEQLLHYLNKNREVATTTIPNQTRVGDSMQNEGRRPLGRSSRIPAWGSEVSGGGKRRDRRGAMKRQGLRGLSAPDLDD